MTCIIGVVEPDGTIWMGADATTSFGQFVMANKQPKILRIGDMLVGVSGSPRVQHLMQCGLSLPSAPEGKDAYNYLCIDFMTALRMLLIEHGAMKSTNGANDGDFHMIIGFRSRLFYADGLFAVYESVRGYEASGSGSELSHGSLTTTKWIGGFNAEQRISMALKVANEAMPSIGYPFTIERL